MASRSSALGQNRISNHRTKLKLGAVGEAIVSCLHGQRTERRIQHINEPSRLVVKPNLAVELPSKRLHHAGTEASPSWRADCRAAYFGPCQSQPLSFIVDRPRDFDPAGLHRQRAELRG